MRERGVYQAGGSDTEEGVDDGHLCVGGERVGRGGGGIYTKWGPGGSGAVDGLLEGHGRENDMMSSSPIRGSSRSAKACAKRVRTKI